MIENKTKNRITDTWQCTLYAYERAKEMTGSYPCWYDGKGTDGYGKYRDAKYWKDHPRYPFVYIANPTKFKIGDVLVFNGNYGHVAIVEDVKDYMLLVGDCHRVKPHTYAEEWWNYKNGSMSGDPLPTGKLMGVLRNENFNPQPTEDITTEQAIDKMARDVIKGMYGNGLIRKNKLYSAIQGRVNEILK